MADQFDATDWYWITRTGKIYSSRRNQFVFPHDYAYLAFVQRNMAAAPWPNDIAGKQTSASLMETLAFYGIFQTVPNP